MRSEGGSGRGGREYGDAAAVLRGRLMDDAEPRVRPEPGPEAEHGWPGAPGDEPDGGHDDIDNELIRWGWDLADDRYLEAS